MLGFRCLRGAAWRLSARTLPVRRTRAPSATHRRLLHSALDQRYRDGGSNQGPRGRSLHDSAERRRATNAGTGGHHGTDAATPHIIKRLALVQRGYGRDGLRRRDAALLHGRRAGPAHHAGTTRTPASPANTLRSAAPSPLHTAGAETAGLDQGITLGLASATVRGWVKRVRWTSCFVLDATVPRAVHHRLHSILADLWRGQAENVGGKHSSGPGLRVCWCCDEGGVALDRESPNPVARFQAPGFKLRHTSTPWCGQHATVAGRREVARTGGRSKRLSRFRCLA